jgi:hypothetical protein
MAGMDGLEWSNYSKLNSVLMFLTRCRFRRRTRRHSSYSTLRIGWRFIRTLDRLEVYRTYGQVGGLSVRYRLEVPYGQVVLLEASLTVQLRYLY